MGFAQTTLSITGILTTTNYSLGIATTGSLKVAAGIASNQLQKWIAPCSYIDNVLVGIVASINAKKQEIVNIAASASANTPPTLDPTCTLGNTADGVSGVYANGENRIIAIGIGVTAGNNVGLATTAVVGYGTVYADTLVAYRYPNLEVGNYISLNPLENPGDETITSSNLGIGISSRLGINTGSFIGTVFQITGGGGSCSGWANSITDLINEIAALRVSISSYTNSVTSVKRYKHRRQLKYWSINKSISIANTSITTNTSILSILNNPANGGPYLATG